MRLTGEASTCHGLSAAYFGGEQMAKANTGNPVVDAILNGTTNVEVRDAMLVGSYLESGWSPTAVGDQGTSFGPFQMHIGGALTAAGGTPADAENPTWAVQNMLAAYEQGVQSVDASLWSSNPELASEEAAVAAERPTESYIASQGQSRVDAAWSATQSALKGVVSTPGSPNGSGASATTTGVNIGSIMQQIEQGLLGGLGSTATGGATSSGLGGLFGSLASWFLGQFGVNSVKDAAIRLGLILLGAILIIVGINAMVKMSISDVETPPEEETGSSGPANTSSGSSGTAAKPSASKPKQASAPKPATVGKVSTGAKSSVATLSEDAAVLAA
jgi:hypothetical protein